MRKLTWGEVLEKDFTTLLLIFVIGVILFALPAIIFIVFGSNIKTVLVFWMGIPFVVCLWVLWNTRRDFVICPACRATEEMRDIGRADVKMICRSCAVNRPYVRHYHCPD